MRYEHVDPRIEAINAVTCNGGEPFPWNAYAKKGVRIDRHKEAVALKAERKQARKVKRNLKHATSMPVDEAAELEAYYMYADYEADYCEEEDYMEYVYPPCEDCSATCESKYACKAYKKYMWGERIYPDKYEGYTDSIMRDEKNARIVKFMTRIVGRAMATALDQTDGYTYCDHEYWEAIKWDIISDAVVEYTQRKEG